VLRTRISRARLFRTTPAAREGVAPHRRGWRAPVAGRRTTGGSGHLPVVRFTLFFKIVVGIVLVLAVLWVFGVGGFLGRAP
jgi:hypothetical protein